MGYFTSIIVVGIFWALMGRIISKIYNIYVSNTESCEMELLREILWPATLLTILLVLLINLFKKQ